MRLRHWDVASLPAPKMPGLAQLVDQPAHFELRTWIFEHVRWCCPGTVAVCDFWSNSNMDPTNRCSSLRSHESIPVSSSKKQGSLMLQSYIVPSRTWAQGGRCAVLGCRGYIWIHKLENSISAIPGEPFVFKMLWPVAISGVADCWISQSKGKCVKLKECSRGHRWGEARPCASQPYFNLALFVDDNSPFMTSVTPGLTEIALRFHSSKSLLLVCPKSMKQLANRMLGYSTRCHVGLKPTTFTMMLKFKEVETKNKSDTIKTWMSDTGQWGKCMKLSKVIEMEH